jgi:hypothetical protein
MFLLSAEGNLNVCHTTQNIGDSLNVQGH